MKLYNAVSGNTKRVRVFLAEKRIDIEQVDIELGKDTRTPDFLKKNTLGEVPVLELDDGRILTESRAICRYLDLVYPDKPLMGLGAFEQGNIAMWSERMHSQIFMTYGMMVRHSLALFADVVDQVPAYADSLRKSIPGKWQWLDQEMADERPFIAGDTFSFADVEGITILMIADAFDLGVPKDCEYVLHWSSEMRARPSWNA